MQSIKVIVEKHHDGYIGYPVGLKGVVIGEGNTFEEALSDTTSAVKFHIETFGKVAFEETTPVLDVYIAEAEVGV